MSKDPQEQIWKLMGDIDVAMVVTHSGDGDSVRARPMAPRVEADDNAIYFLTDAEAPKDQEIENNSSVCLTFSDNRAQKYVSVTGAAEVLSSATLAERVWRTGDKLFWSGPNDARIRVIRVTPDKGEYWEGSGFVATVASMIVASAKGARPNLGDSAKVAM